MTSTLSVPFQVTAGRPGLRVALVTHNVCRGDGQGRVNYEIARHCAAGDVRVTVIADRVDSDLLERGVSWIPVRPRHRRPILLKSWEFAGLADDLMRDHAEQFDVIVANGFTLRAPHHVNISHMVHAAWWKVMREAGPSGTGPREWYHRLYTYSNTRWERESYRAAERVVAVSGRIRRELLMAGVEANRIQLIHHGVDLQEFSPGRADRSALELPNDMSVALFVGDIRTPLKNLDTIVSALARMPDLVLAVAASTDGSPYPALVRKLGLSQRVRFLGYRHDLPRVMRMCDFLIFPSRCDAFGLAVLEAMASGLPVIVAATAGASEIVTPDCGVVLEDPNDAAQWCQSMRWLAQDGALRRRLGAASRATAQQHSWSKMADRYLRLFEEAAA